MEGNYLTAGDLALMRTEGRGGYGDGYYGGGCYHHGRGMAATGIGLASAALIGALAIGWGVNQASKSRMRAAENAAAGNAKAIDILAQTAICERQSREAWQGQHAPTITQYTDVRTGAGAFSNAGANALATAEALSLLNNGGANGLNSAIGGCNYLRVARVSGSKLCGCDTCEG